MDDRLLHLHTQEGGDTDGISAPHRGSCYCCLGESTVCTEPILTLSEQRFAVCTQAKAAAAAAAPEEHAEVPLSSFSTPNASPASMRSTRSHGESGKPSPPSAAMFERPPRTKRHAKARDVSDSRRPDAPSSSASRPRRLDQRLGSAPESARILAPANAWMSGAGWIGRKEAASRGTAAGAATEAEASSVNLDLHAWPTLGRKQQAATGGAPQSRPSPKPMAPPPLRMP